MHFPAFYCESGSGLSIEDENTEWNTCTHNKRAHNKMEADM